MDLFDAVAPFARYGPENVALFMGVFSRISGLMFFLPGLGERTVSMRVRLAAALAVSLVLSPIVAPSAPDGEPGPGALVATVAAEGLAGAILGFSIRIAIYALQVAGSIAAQGVSLSQLFAGLEDAPEAPIGTFFMFAGIAVALSTGLHFEAVRALAYSYEIMPYGFFPGADDTGAWAAERGAFIFSAALALSMPFVILGFVYNLAIGAMNRAMPQLMVSFVGAPAVSLAGLALLALAAPVVLGAWRDLLGAIMATLTGAAP